MVFLFSITIFLSAFLLFLIQPMLAKAILPALGGTPNVWNTCVLSFQVLLLVGYGYAYLQSKLAKHLNVAAWLHAIVFTACILFSTFHVIPDRPELFFARPTYYLVWHITLSVGALFFILSCTSPLLQDWLGRSKHAASRSPYFLYVASNLGSLAGLLLYPLYIEKILPLNEQIDYLFFGSIIVAVLIFICVFIFEVDRERNAQVAQEEEKTPTDVTPNKWRQVPLWILLSFIPSSLMLGLTTHVTTNIAAVPLFWVLPLAGYLLTFVIAFSARPLVSLETLARFFPIVIIIGAPLPFYDLIVSPILNAFIQFFLFLYIALTCHLCLANRKPSPKDLTQFYFFLSFGGALGGFVNSIVAPTYLNSVIEYPIVFALAVVAYCFAFRDVDEERIDYRILIAVVATIGGEVWVTYYSGDLATKINLALGYGIPCLIIFALRHKPWIFGLSFLILFSCFMQRELASHGDMIFSGRNFYGARSVVVNREDKIVFLRHGTINHGSQSLIKEKRLEPLSYFSKSGPVGDIFRLFDSENLNGQVGVVGLGIGSIACYAKPGEQFVFFELDPMVNDLAHNEQYFTFLSDCAGKYETVMGDGRLTLAYRRPKEFKLLFLDAFSSDSVPVHLLTEEALSLYLSKVQSDGMIVFNISNQFLDFRGLIAAHAKAFNLEMLYRDNTLLPPEDEHSGKLGSIFAVLTRNHALIEKLQALKTWQPSPIEIDKQWSDQYSNVFSIMKF